MTEKSREEPLDASKTQALTILAEENYAHARDHEHLRGQVTSILVAASFVLIGTSIRDLSGPAAIVVAFLSISIGVLNIWVVLIHNNRFDNHVESARDARSQISDVGTTTKSEKLGSLSGVWLCIAGLPVLGGLGILLLQLVECVP